MKVVAGRSVIKSDADDVIEQLERLIERVKSGDLGGANRLVVFIAQSDVEKFSFATIYSGRAIECLGYTKIAETKITNDILGGSGA